MYVAYVMTIKERLKHKQLSEFLQQLRGKNKNITHTFKNINQQQICLGSNCLEIKGLLYLMKEKEYT